VKLEPFEFPQSGVRKWSDLLGVLREEVTLSQSPRSGAVKWSASWSMERAGKRLEA